MKITLRVLTLAAVCRATRYACVAAGLFCVLPAGAADRYWVNGSGNWNDTSHWSTNSGGSTGASVPAGSDLAIFDGGNSSNCTINANVDVIGIDIRPGYTGTIIQNDNMTVTLGADGFSQGGGTFQGGSNADFNLPWASGATFTLTNGTFNAGNQEILSCDTWTVTGGTFNAGASTVIFRGNKAVIGSHSLNNVRLWAGSSGGNNLTLSNTLTVTGTLTLDSSGSAGGYGINEGTLAIQGDFIQIGGDRSDIGSTGTWLFNGSSNQTWSSEGGWISTVEIDKSGGTLTLADTIQVLGAFTLTAGDLNAGTSTVVFIGTQTLTGSVDLNNVHFYSGSSGDQTFTIALGTTQTVNGTLSIDSEGLVGGSMLMTGTIKALGDITMDDRRNDGDALLLITGTNDQIFTGPTNFLTYPNVPNVVIDKSGGILTLANSIMPSYYWTYTNGIVDSGTSTISFDAVWDTDITGSMTFHNLRFSTVGSGTRTIPIAPGTTLTATNKLLFHFQYGNANINNGIIDVSGDVEKTPESSETNRTFGGTALLRFVGSGNQAIDLSGGYEDKVDLDMEIDKAGGELLLASALTMNASDQDLTITDGTLNIGTNRLNLTGTGSDYTNSSSNVTLKLALADTNTLIDVAGNTTIDGTLYVELVEGFQPVSTDTNTILTSGSAVANTPFDATEGGRNLKYDVLYNDGGFNIKLTHIRIVVPGMMMTIQ